MGSQMTRCAQPSAARSGARVAQVMLASVRLVVLVVVVALLCAVIPGAAATRKPPPLADLSMSAASQAQQMALAVTQEDLPNGDKVFSLDIGQPYDRAALQSGISETNAQGIGAFADLNLQIDSVSGPGAPPSQSVDNVDGTLATTDGGLQITIHPHPDEVTITASWWITAAATAVGILVYYAVRSVCIATLTVTVVGVSAAVVCASVGAFVGSVTRSFILMGVDRQFKDGKAWGIALMNAIIAAVGAAVWDGGLKEWATTKLGPLMSEFGQGVVAIGQKVRGWFGLLGNGIINAGNALRQVAAYIPGLARTVNTANLPPQPDPGPPVKDRDVFLKVMPLGDSVTDGVGSSKGYGYRQPLRDKLVGGGSTVDMVGFNRSGDMDDADHEGHSGKRIAEIFESSDNGITSFKPNVITLMAGTNDLGQQFDVGGAPQRLNTMIQQVRTLDDGVVIAVATLADSSDAAQQQRIDSYNASISELVRGYPEDYHVILADMNAVTTADMSDPWHPNDSGYEKIATSFSYAINTAVDKGWVGDREQGASGVGGNGTPSRALGTINWYPQGDIAGGVGSDGDSIRLADLNGDGRDDYLSVDDDGAVYARINGNGTPNNWLWYDYQKVALGVGSDGDSIRFADINGDGRDDYLVVADNGQTNLWINGGGTPNDWSWDDYGVIAWGVGAPRSQVRFADLNGDGRDDYIALADNGSARAWLNTGGAKNDWGWDGVETIALGVGAPGSQVRFADINGDGFDDYLAVADNGATKAWLNGDGVQDNWGWNEVVEPIASGVGAPGDQVRFADLNDDHRADYIVVNPENGAMTARTN